MKELIKKQINLLVRQQINTRSIYEFIENHIDAYESMDLLDETFKFLTDAFDSSKDHSNALLDAMNQISKT